jgi:hypothetical protein
LSTIWMPRIRHLWRLRLAWRQFRHPSSIVGLPHAPLVVRAAVVDVLVAVPAAESRG